jgi:hypothetical protein
VSCVLLSIQSGDVYIQHKYQAVYTGVFLKSFADKVIYSEGPCLALLAGAHTDFLLERKDLGTSL